MKEFFTLFLLFYNQQFVEDWDTVTKTGKMILYPFYIWKCIYKVLLLIPVYLMLFSVEYFIMNGLLSLYFKLKIKYGN